MKIDAFFMAVAMFAGIFFAVGGMKSKPKKLLNVYGGFIMILAGLTSTFAFPAKGKPDVDYSLLRTCYIVIIFWLVIISIPYIKKYFKNKKEKEQREELKAKKREELKVREYDDECIRVYELYEKNNYDINNDEVNRIISASHNIPLEHIKSMYKRGKEAEIIRENEAILRKIEFQRKKETTLFEQEKQNINLIGKEKYLDFLNKKLNAHKAIQFAYDALGDAYISGSVEAKNVKQTDPYFFAGIANGIGGRTASLMTANEIINENENKKIEGAIISQNSMNEAVKMKEESLKSNDVIKNLNYMINIINNSLIDNDTSNNFEKMIITKKLYKVLNTNNIEVVINYELGDISVLDRIGIMDGSLDIRVLNSKNEEVAQGYYNAPNILLENEKYVDCSNVGFKPKGSIKVLCISKNYNDVNPNEEYKIIVKPVNLWIIENIDC